MEVTTRTVDTDRLSVFLYECGPSDGIPVVLIHGNLATGRFFEPTMRAAPAGYRMLAPDMRGFGRTERRPLDATRGLKEWADDTRAVVQALGIDAPVHLAGWSTGGAAIAEYAIATPDEVASLTFIDPVSPFGFGGTKDVNGTPTSPDYAGSGAAAGNPEFAQRLADGDRSTDSDVSPLNVMRNFYWSPGFSMEPEWEQVLLSEVLLSEVGPTGYPGDVTSSANWPGAGPGAWGVLNALSGKHCNWSAIADIEPKPPVLWTHGENDLVVADASPWDLGTLGQMGLVPDWPGTEVHPPQPMVSQIRAVLDQYSATGGEVSTKIFAGSGHGPLIDAAAEWQSVFFDFLAGSSRESTQSR